MYLGQTAIIWKVTNQNPAEFYHWLSNIVMQAQVFSETDPLPSRIKRRSIINGDFPNNGRRLRENRIMVIKSFSYNHNQSLCVKSLLHKENLSNVAKSNPFDRLFTHKPVLQTNPSESREVALKKDLSHCQKQLRHFRHLQKSDIFFKINEMERKISRQIRNAKQRENKRYQTQTKTNKMKWRSHNNSINLSDIPAAIRIKHIQNNRPQHKPDKKMKTYSSFHQERLMTIFDHQRFLKDINNNHVSISHLVKINREAHFSKEPQGEEFSGWDTQQDYDF